MGLSLAAMSDLRCWVVRLPSVVRHACEDRTLTPVRVHILVHACVHGICTGRDRTHSIRSAPELVDCGDLPTRYCNGLRY